MSDRIGHGLPRLLHPFAGTTGRRLAGERRPEERATVKRKPHRRMSELYHERFCRITEMHPFVVLPVLLLLTFACGAAVVLALWPHISADASDVEATRRPAKPRQRVFALATTWENSCGRAHARLEPPRHGPGGRGTPGARRRRSRRVRSG